MILRKLGSNYGVRSNGLGWAINYFVAHDDPRTVQNPRLIELTDEVSVLLAKLSHEHIYVEVKLV